MKRIIKIENEVLFIGCEDGSISEARLADCSGFTPAVGDSVEVYSTETRTIVTKVESTQDKSNKSTDGKINITVSNNQGITPQGTIYTASNLKAVNKGIYCVLALLLGGIGIHKFYAGKIGTGILFILFCWTYIPLVISLLDFLIGIFKPSDANGNILV